MNRAVFAACLACAVLSAPLAAQDVVISRPTLGIPTDAGAFLTGTLARSAAGGPELTEESVAAFFDAAFSVQSKDHAMVGAVVSVVKDGEVLFKRGYGWANLERRVPADPDRSLYRIASITKTFVWTGLMQLVEQGKVDLDADVNRYLDFEIPSTFEEPIRVWHLMTHTPGFEETWAGWAAREIDDVGELGETLAELMPARVWPPGEHAAYSNYGAALAGYIVERVSGQPWPEYTEEHILGPLGMSSTNVRVSMRPELRDRHATGYVFVTGQFIPTPYSLLRLPPAGLMSATAADMATFMMAHLNRGAVGDTRILKESTALRMQSPLFAPHEGVLPMLHGFYRSDRNGQVVFGHGGDANQFHSNMSLLPESGLGVFVSYNSDPAAVSRSNVIPAFIDHFFPAEYLRPAPEPADIDLSDYEGDYVPLRNAFSTFERVRTAFMVGSLSTVGDELRFNGGAPWVPVAKDRFTGLYGDAAIVFERDDRGEVTHVVAGSPLSTLKRVSAFEGHLAQPLLWYVLLMSLGAVLAWGYRVIRPIPEERRLPSPHVRVAWLHAALMATLIVAFFTLGADIGYGIPISLHAVLIAFNANVLLGLAVIVFSVRQWTGGHGTWIGRSGYALVALASIVNLWLGWSFNLIGYLF